MSDVTLPNRPRIKNENNVWDPNVLEWVAMLQPATSSAGGALTTKEVRSTTAVVTSVADIATSTTLLSSNTSRLGASIENDSTASLYVKLGTTASLTDYTVIVVTNAYYEVPFAYTGRIDGIWATDPGTGAARITELT